MKKIVLVIIALLILCVAIVVVMQQTPKILSPLISTSPTYDLSSLLSKNGLIATTPVMSNGALIASVSGILVDFSPQKDLGEQVRALQLVLPKVKMEQRRVLEIDLRFNKVVIKY